MACRLRSLRALRPERRRLSSTTSPTLRAPPPARCSKAGRPPGPSAPALVASLGPSSSTPHYYTQTHTRRRRNYLRVSLEHLVSPEPLRGGTGTLSPFPLYRLAEPFPARAVPISPMLMKGAKRGPDTKQQLFRQIDRRCLLLLSGARSPSCPHSFPSSFTPDIPVRWLECFFGR